MKYLKFYSSAISDRFMHNFTSRSLPAIDFLRLSISSDLYLTKRNQESRNLIKLLLVPHCRVNASKHRNSDTLIDVRNMGLEVDYCNESMCQF